MSYLKLLIKFAKQAADDGIAHGATPDPDLINNVPDAIDRAFESDRQYREDPSSMTQPGVLHGLLNRMDQEQQSTIGNVNIPLINVVH